jgi:hypothetical protein
MQGFWILDWAWRMGHGAWGRFSAMPNSMMPNSMMPNAP